MHLPERSKRYEWNFNTLVTLCGIGATIFVNVAFVATTWTDTKRDIKELQDQVQDETDARKARGILTDGRFLDLNRSVAEITPLSFQVTRAIEGVSENKKAVESANTRIDRVVESFGGKLDTVIDSVNKIATRVEVLSSKLDDAQTRSDKTLYRTPIVRP
jgi:methyl-accepting chemotaxis protein